MKIAFFIHSLEMGGAERVLSTLAAELAKTHDVKVFLFDGRRPAFDIGSLAVDMQLPSQGSKTSKVLQLLRRCLAIYKIQREHRFDTVISFMEGASIPAAVAATIGGWRDRLTVSIRQNPYAFNWLVRLVMKILYRYPISINTNSHGSMKAMKNLTGRDVKLIHNPLPKLEEGSQVYNLGRYLLFLGRLDPVKRVTDIISAFYESLSALPSDLVLVIAGAGPDEQNLRNLCQKLSLSNRVIFLGAVTRPRILLEKAECVILASQTEGWPNVLMEALQVHAPVISSDCPYGPREILEGVDFADFLFPVGDIQALASRLDKVIAGKFDRSQYERKCDAFLSKFQPAEIAKHWLAETK